jgi:hypothetical protein
MNRPNGYLLALQSYMDPANGTVTWNNARIAAKLLKLSDEFVMEYGHMYGDRVDFGEFNVWARNLI